MALSPNYSWSEPDNSSLVKNGAADIRTLGDAIDTSVWNIGFGQAGKNKIINGDCRIAQRGSSVTNTGTGYFYGAVDRFQGYSYANNTCTVSQQSFTAGSAPVTGYEAPSFIRIASTSTATFLSYRVEDARTFANSTTTISFWAKSASAQTIQIGASQNFGSGGSATVSILSATNVAITTSWARYSATITVPSISGKTVGTSSYIVFEWVGAVNNNLDIWGVQWEQGLKATPFQTATGTIQGELAACQRYYQQYAGGLGVPYNGVANSSTTLMTYLAIQPTMRTAATCTVGGTLYADDGYSGTVSAASPTVDFVDQYQGGGRFRIGGFSGMTTGRHYSFYYNTGYIGLSAEL